MYRKIAVAGATAAAIVGVGTAALATSGSDVTTGSGKTATTNSAKANAKQHAKRGPAAALRRGLHGQITTKGKDGYVTHSGIRGTVTSVSATSITVRAVDGYTQTFTIGKSTKVRERTAATAGKAKAKATPGKVSDLKTGDTVGVLGKAPEKSTAKPTATVVIDGLKK